MNNNFVFQYSNYFVLIRKYLIFQIAKRLINSDPVLFMSSFLNISVVELLSVMENKLIQYVNAINNMFEQCDG